MQRTKIIEGNEVRGLRVRAYPTAEQIADMRDLQRRLRRLWNWLVARAEDTRRAREAWAVRYGHVPPMPERPAQDAGKRTWQDYWRGVSAWRAQVRAACKDAPECTYRNVRDWCGHFGVRHDYQLFARVFDEPAPPAGILQSMFVDYDQAMRATSRGAAPPRRKKRDEDVTLRTGTGKQCWRLGAFGPRPKAVSGQTGPQPYKPSAGRADWLNVSVKLPGVRGRIACRLSSEQPYRSDCRVVEGVSLRCEADGWYAAVRQELPIRERELPQPTERACGIDVGLVNLFALTGTDGVEVVASNPRKGESMRRRRHAPHGYVELIAARQAAELPSGRLQQKLARHVRAIVRQDLFPICDRYGMIVVEDLPSDIGFRVPPHLSLMRTTYRMLVERYGDRVRAVDPADTSRQCSQCGKLHEKSWSALPGRRGECECGHSEDSDVNAARNVLRKGLELLES